MSSSRTIPQIEAEIQAVKVANPDWMSNPGVLAFITELLAEKRGINQSTAPAGAHIPLVTSTVQSSSAIVHEVPITVVANGRTIRLLFVLDGGCEVDLVISDEAASLLGFDDLNDDHFENGDAGVAGGGVVLFRIYRGIVEVNFTTGRGSTRKTNCANVYIGGPDNLMGLPTQGRLRVGVADTSGTISIFPVRPARIV